MSIPNKAGTKKKWKFTFSLFWDFKSNNLGILGMFRNFKICAVLFNKNLKACIIFCLILLSVGSFSLYNAKPNKEAPAP